MLRVITSRNKKPSSPSYSEFRAPSLLHNIQDKFFVGTWPRYNKVSDVFIDRLTYRSLMSEASILCWSLIWILWRYCATSFEFLVAYVYGNCIIWLSFLLRYLASMYDDASGIYKPQCTTCKKSYVGQTGRSLKTRHREYIRYIKTNNPLSAYATHILNKRHEPCQKGKLMKCWETLYIQQLQQQQLLIEEQRSNDINPLYSLANTSHRTNQTHHSSVDTWHA